MLYAFINIVQNAKIKKEEIISFCRERLPHYMVPKAMVFMEFPNTSTGKIHKFLLKYMVKRCSNIYIYTLEEASYIIIIKQEEEEEE